MSVKFAINGFGRIGRCVGRILCECENAELVAINDTASRDLTRYLLQYDTIHGEFKHKVEVINDDFIAIDGKKIRVFSTRNPNELEFNADIVFECTGAFLTQESCEIHIKNGANLVVISAPPKDDTPMFVMGVNNEKFAKQKIISNASCTTNCLAPLAKVLDDKFGILKGLMNTTHAYTATQKLLDTKTKNIRRSRSAPANIIPTSTGAAKAISKILPNLEGKMHGIALRVPIADVSLVDLTALLNKNVSVDDINQAFYEYANSTMSGILSIDNDFRVSSDFITSSFSAILVADMTQVVGENLVKILAWYDNEWGYSKRLVELGFYAHERLKNDR